MACGIQGFCREPPDDASLTGLSSVKDEVMQSEILNQSQRTWYSEHVDLDPTDRQSVGLIGAIAAI